MPQRGLACIEPSTYQHGYTVIVSLVMILYWKKVSPRSPSATDEAWHWPKTGYSTLGMDSSELWVELAVQYCVSCADNWDWYWSLSLSLSRACGSTACACGTAGQSGCRTRTTCPGDVEKGSVVCALENNSSFVDYWHLLLLNSLKMSTVMTDVIQWESNSHVCECIYILRAWRNRSSFTTSFPFLLPLK